MQNTTNYNLKKPEGTENYNIEHQNDNMNIIDTEIKGRADQIGILSNLTTTEKGSLVGAVNEVDAGLSSHKADIANPHGVTKSQVGLSNVDNVQQAPITHVGAGGTEHAIVTTTVNGFMSASDKSKLNGIEAGAEVNDVTSVASKTGAVTLVKGDVGLGSVDNKSATTIRQETGQLRTEIGRAHV